MTRTYQFLEAAVARITTGGQTSHGCPWDVELDHFGEAIQIEVKFSQEFECSFREGTRQVFKFAAPKGTGEEKPSHVTVLLGIDGQDDVHSWATPSASLAHSTSITHTFPRARQGGASLPRPTPGAATSAATRTTMLVAEPNPAAPRSKPAGS